jgi:hypothetical protein
MKDIVHAIRILVDEASAMLTHMAPDQVATRPGTGEWSKKEILGHLIDSAVNNHQRFVRAQFADPFIWPGYDQQAWVPLHRYAQRPWIELVDLWVALNHHVAAVVESVPADKLQTSCVIGGREPAPLEWWMRDYLRHLKHHLGQLDGA